MRQVEERRLIPPTLTHSHPHDQGGVCGGTAPLTSCYVICLSVKNEEKKVVSVGLEAPGAQSATMQHSSFLRVPNGVTWPLLQLSHVVKHHFQRPE